MTITFFVLFTLVQKPPCHAVFLSSCTEFNFSVAAEFFYIFIGLIFQQKLSADIYSLQRVNICCNRNFLANKKKFYRIGP